MVKKLCPDVKRFNRFGLELVDKSGHKYRINRAARGDIFLGYFSGVDFNLMMLPSADEARKEVFKDCGISVDDSFKLKVGDTCTLRLLDSNGGVLLEQDCLLDSESRFHEDADESHHYESSKRFAHYFDEDIVRNFFSFQSSDNMF